MSERLVGGWAVGRFGMHVALVRAGVLSALQAAHARAAAAHDAAGLTTNDVYGEALWLAQHEELIAHGAGLQSSSTFQPHGSRYVLLTVGGVVIYPWRYGSNVLTPLDETPMRHPVSDLRRRLFRTHAAAPSVEDGTLFSWPPVAVGGERSSSAGGLVVVAYASNPRGGLLDAQWGEATLQASGLLAWTHREVLPLTVPVAAAAASAAGTPACGPIAPAEHDPAPFDERPAPVVPLRLRSTPTEAAREASRQDTMAGDERRP